MLYLWIFFFSLINLFDSQTQENKRLLIEIVDMELEATELNFCPDSLEIRYFALGQMGPRLCGSVLDKLVLNKEVQNNSINFTSHRNAALLYFRSDWFKTSRGFKIKVSIKHWYDKLITRVRLLTSNQKLKYYFWEIK